MLSLTMCKAKDLSVKVLNVITRIIKVKILVKYSSCDCKCNYDGTICTSNQKCQ